MNTISHKPKITVGSVAFMWRRHNWKNDFPMAKKVDVVVLGNVLVQQQVWYKIQHIFFVASILYSALRPESSRTHRSQEID